MKNWSQSGVLSKIFSQTTTLADHNPGFNRSVNAKGRKNKCMISRFEEFEVSLTAELARSIFPHEDSLPLFGVSTVVQV
jgi:hypothetical protein